MTARAGHRPAARRISGSMPALGSRPFRLLAGGQFVSNVGDGSYAVALPWYVLSHHGGAILLGTVLAAYGIPRTGLIMVGGHLADRLSPWAVMMAADIGRLGLAGGLAVLAATQHPAFLTLAPIAFGLGAGEGLFLPASYAIMPRLVADDQLQSGNALLSASTQLAVFAGPALGGAVVAALSSAAGFGLDALSFAVSALTLWRLAAILAARSGARAANSAGLAGQPAPTPATGSRQITSPGPEPVSRRFRSFVRRERVVPLIMAINIVANLGSAGTSEVALPLFAREHLHAGAGGYGALIACVGIGALAGSLAATRLNRARRPAVAAGLIFLAQVPFMVCLLWAPGLAVAATMVALWGGLNMWANVTTQTAFQRWAPPDLIGRLSGLLLVTSYGMFPISVALAGLIVHRYGPGPFFILAAVALAATLAWALSQQAFRDFGMRLAAEPSAQSVFPDPAVVES
ncbi:MAG TPA: MFS transporter [Streptosporangiaceae bacterium]|nr:MFS transporter [Streptosporangiaceae bacterium]